MTGLWRPKERGMSVSSLATAVQSSNEFFESVYAEAQGDASRVRWADERANPRWCRG